MIRENRDQKVKVQVGAEVYEFSTLNDLSIDRDDLDTELAHQASTYGWFRVLYERAKGIKATAEAELAELEGEVADSIRLTGEGDKKALTETAIKQRVRADLRVKKMTRAVASMEQNERFLYAIVSAFEQRKDMLISLARSRATELNMPSAAEVDRMKRNILGR
jgi:hypothetical protein